MSRVLTRHAADRYRQRVGAGVPAPSQAVKIPARHVRRRWRDLGRATRKGGPSYRCSANALWVFIGGAAVTCIALTLDDLATVLVWLLFGDWLPEAA